MIQKIELINGNCLKEMEKMQDKSIDLILCDLPYGTTQCSWDTTLPFDLLWKHYKRIIKENKAIVLTASQPFTSALVMSNPSMFKYEWIWIKNNATGHLNAKRKPLSVFEDILVFGTGKIPYQPQGLVSFNKMVRRGHNGKNYGVSGVENYYEKNKAHPIQKPVDLFEYLIKTYTKEGDLVLDNCMGSGTTGIACKRLNRGFIGIELDPNYFNIAKKRIGGIK